MLRTVTGKFESTMGFDATEPCKVCPFRLDVPCELKGIQDIGIVGLECMTHGEVMHSCHKTDSRADGFVEGYTGKVQHCAGFLLMAKKSGFFTGPMLRAIGSGKLNMNDLRSTDKVHTLRDLLQAMVRWGKETLE